MKNNWKKELIKGVDNKERIFDILAKNAPQNKFELMAFLRGEEVNISRWNRNKRLFHLITRHQLKDALISFFGKENITVRHKGAEVFYKLIPKIK